MPLFQFAVTALVLTLCLLLAGAAPGADARTYVRIVGGRGFNASAVTQACGGLCPSGVRDYSGCTVVTPLPRASCTAQQNLTLTLNVFDDASGTPNSISNLQWKYKSIRDDLTHASFGESFQYYSGSTATGVAGLPDLISEPASIVSPGNDSNYVVQLPCVRFLGSSSQADEVVLTLSYITSASETGEQCQDLSVTQQAKLQAAASPTPDNETCSELWGWGKSENYYLPTGPDVDYSSTNMDVAREFDIFGSPLQFVRGYGYEGSVFGLEDGSVWSTGNQNYGSIPAGEGRLPTRAIWADNVTAVDHRVFSRFEVIGAVMFGVLPNGSVAWAGDCAQVSDCGADQQRLRLHSFFNGTAPERTVVDVCNVTHLDAAYHLLWRTANGSVWGTGSNSNGQLGTGDTSASNSVPRIIAQIDALAWSRLRCVNSQTWITLRNGTVLALGDNNELNMGLQRGTSNANVLTATPLPMPATPPGVQRQLVDVYANSYDDGNVFLFDDGTIYGAGDAKYAGIGIGYSTEWGLLLPLWFNTAGVRIEAVFSHVGGYYFLDAQHRLWYTGYNGYAAGGLSQRLGTLYTYSGGNGQGLYLTTPTLVPAMSGKNVLFFGGDGSTSLAIVAKELPTLQLATNSQRIARNGAVLRVDIPAGLGGFVVDSAELVASEDGAALALCSNVTIAADGRSFTCRAPAVTDDTDARRLQLRVSFSCTNRNALARSLAIAYEVDGAESSGAAEKLLMTIGTMALTAASMLAAVV